MKLSVGKTQEKLREKITRESWNNAGKALEQILERNSEAFP